MNNNLHPIFRDILNARFAASPEAQAAADRIMDELRADGCRSQSERDLCEEAEERDGRLGG